MSAAPHIIFTFPVLPGKVGGAVRLFRHVATFVEEAEFYTEDASPTAKKKVPVAVRKRVAFPELLEMRFNALEKLYEATVFYPILVQPVGATSLHYEIVKDGKDGMENKKICRLTNIYGVLNSVMWLSEKREKGPWYSSRSRPLLGCKFCGLPAPNIQSLHDESGHYRFRITGSKMGKQWGFVTEVTVPISELDFHQMFSFELCFPDDYSERMKEVGIIRDESERKTISFVPYEDVRSGEWLLTSWRRIPIPSAQ